MIIKGQYCNCLFRKKESKIYLGHQSVQDLSWMSKNLEHFDHYFCMAIGTDLGAIKPFLIS
ncbi:MAG: hypothetical protein B6247_00525 [Candidatus Parabeggiatoa sp. nov. 2]|nr:MAG: hypothetical protein B6247_00525 [Beggiatoa sp. 4572_84]